MRTYLAVAIIVGLALTVRAIDIDDMDELEGFTLIAKSTVAGDFEGADYNKLVKLENGMIFEFDSYNYDYSYQPPAAVFAKKVTLGGQNLVVYKLVINDTIYDVTRVR